MGDRHFSHNFGRHFVLPQSEKRGSSQLAVAGPFLKCDLADSN
jgi:hypothetical protein